MAEVTIRRATADDALVVAALHLQLARQLGMPPEQGFLDRFAEVWLDERPERPTWIAEARGEHAGILETRRIRALPWPGRPTVTWLQVGVLFVTRDQRRCGVGEALLRGMIEWARTTDVRWIRVTVPDEEDRPFYSRLGFTAPESVLELDLGERP